MSDECNCGEENPILCRTCGVATECTAIDLCGGCIATLFEEAEDEE